MIGHLLVKTKPSRTSVQVTSPSIRVTGRPMASSTGSMQVDDDADGGVNLPEEEHVCSRCRHNWDNVCALRRHRTALRVQGTACEDEESSTVRRNMQSVPLAIGRMEFRPIFQPGTWESLGCFHLFLIYEVGQLQLHKWIDWNKWVKSY